jgi:hypothetical protein
VTGEISPLSVSLGIISYLVFSWYIYISCIRRFICLTAGLQRVNVMDQCTILDSRISLIRRRRRFDCELFRDICVRTTDIAQVNVSTRDHAWPPDNHSPVFRNDHGKPVSLLWAKFNLLGRGDCCWLQMILLCHLTTVRLLSQTNIAPLRIANSSLLLAPRF